MDASVFLASGKVESVDPKTGHVRITHEEVPSASLAAGTTEFIAEDNAPLTMIKAGQSVEISFLQDVEGKYVITAISPTPPED